MTDKEKYINELAAALSSLDQNDRQDALEFYDEYISDAQLETWQDMETELGSPKQLSRKILADNSLKNNEGSDKRQPASAKSSWKKFWLIIAAIVSSPLTFSLGVLAFVAIIVLMAAAIAALGIIVGLIAAILSLLVIAAVSLYAGIGLLAASTFVGLFYIGLSLSLLGLFMVVVPLGYWLTRVICQAVVSLAKFIYRKIQARRKAS